ncbi:MAG: ABC transporter substrate-binding protein [Dermatophilaceae bacterium]
MKRTTTTLALVGVALLGLTACGGGSSDPLASPAASGESGGAASGGAIVVGSADFSESVVLAEIYAGALKAKGVDASTKTNIGSREIYLKALEDGSIQVVPEYTGALALYYDKAFDKTEPNDVYDALKGSLPANLTVLEKSAAEDNDSIVMTKETAAKVGATTLSELTGKTGDLTLGAPPEFKERAQGIPGLEKTYGITFQDFVPLKGQALVQALNNGQVQAANIFSTDPAIVVNDFVTIKDDKKLFGSQNVVPLVVADRADEVSAALNAVSAKLTTEELTNLLKATDVDKKDPKAVAAEWLKAQGLG